ncbi:MAG: heavy-metal-associated domain-containing protein [Chitinophagales bacterium]|nr:heavy-metal-associated domain-containing protein [Chitinophagales bacterium]
MQTHSLKINGMGGEHCVMLIKNIVSKIEGASISHIEVGRADIEVDESRASKANVVAAIEKMGYKVAQ